MTRKLSAFFVRQKTLCLSVLLISTFLATAVRADERVLSDGWYIQSSERVSAAGAQVSSAGFNIDGWYPTTVPSTVMGALFKNNVYGDVFWGRNIVNVPLEQFKNSWWYRKEFSIAQYFRGQTVKLGFDGIVYKANIWLNGELVASADTIYGTYRRFEVDVTRFIRNRQQNVLAVEVIPPEKGDFSVGFVDWNPKPPDKNMGIFREVILKVSGDASINFPFVKTKVDLATLKSAKISVSAEVVNNSPREITAQLMGQIEGVKFSKQFLLGPQSKKLVAFEPNEYPQLEFVNPRLWWTYNYGSPELYWLNLTLVVNGQVSDRNSARFGIREVSDYINQDGHRGYMLNGKKVTIFAGGWADHLFLIQDLKNLRAQIAYVKHMGLNAIRLEGFWGTNQDLYDLCDQNGILLLAGFSCQWEWEAYSGKPHDEFGSIKTPEDMRLIAESWKHQIKWLRNHPSLLVWLYGSDKLPRPELERMYLTVLNDDDPTRPSLASATGLNSQVTGLTRVKMLGPYDYVPPIYWWQDRRYGGAYGFNTETGPGPQIPPVESIKKMIPQENLWPMDGMWDFHAARGEYRNFRLYNQALNNRLGAAGSLEEYVTKAQFVNYEAMRGMFEAFAGNKNAAATGVVQWMLNASWPKLYWQMYDYYLMPNGSFYGAKKALAPVQLVYNYNDREIIAVNNTLKTFNNLWANVRVVDFAMDKKYDETRAVSLNANGTQKVLTIPALDNLSRTYFLDLRLYNSRGTEVANNFYALSTKADVLDYPNTTWRVTPLKEFADLSALNSLTKVTLLHRSSFTVGRGQHEVTVELTNPTSTLAFNVEVSVLKKAAGLSVLPIFWEDNYFSLLPGETRIIKGYFATADLEGDVPAVKISGWNIM